MCGILGIAGKNCIMEETLRQMRDALIHRGPDDAGIWINANGNIGLAHRRLTIIDLSEAGRQPMSDSKGEIWITYNGEIYNFKELRKDLQLKGYSFRNRTDTEVILNAYKEWGTDCLQKFNGMFAFCIFDDKEKIFFMARDRIGKKPLYYYENNSEKKIVFASEIKALLKDREISKEIDLKALNFYLSFGYIPGELCIFKAIKKLPPAHAMIYHINSGKKNIWSYWDVPCQTAKFNTENELMEEMEFLLKDSVRIRMRSDVPLGAFLSGGVDSSLVVAMMSMVSEKPVKTISIGFEDNRYNELPYARIVANHFGTDHHELIVKPDAFSILPELVRQFDEPFADSSMIPTYYVSKAAREHVTVALSGDGGDELFGGYKHYLWSIFYKYMRMFVPSTVRKKMSQAAGYLPERTRGKRQLLRLRHDLYGAIVELSGHMFFREELRRDLLNKTANDLLDNDFLSPELSRRNCLMQRKGDFVDRVTYTDFKTYLPDDILVKVDRASMFVSLEVRSPLLDYRIAEFSFKNIPGNLKIKRTVTKYLLKKLADNLLPKELNINRKWGFVMPVSNWFRGSLSSQIQEILLGERSIYFNQKYIQQLLDEHMSGIDHSGRLFNLLVFYLWTNEYMGSG